MSVPRVDLKAQHLSVKGEVGMAIRRVLESSRFIIGKEVSSFEREFADFCGTSYRIFIAVAKAPFTGSFADTIPGRCFLPILPPSGA